MKKIPFEKAIPIAFYTLLIVSIGVIGYIGMSRRASAPPLDAAIDESTESPGVIPLTDCDASSEKLCIHSTGNDVEGNLLISLKTGLRPMPPVYARLAEGRVNIRFDCRQVESAHRLLYCLGPFSGEVSLAMVEIYTTDDDILIASGPLVPGEMAQFIGPPSVTLRGQPTPAPTPTKISYPGETPASYPSYPAYP